MSSLFCSGMGDVFSQFMFVVSHHLTDASGLLQLDASKVPCQNLDVIKHSLELNSTPKLSISLGANYISAIFWKEDVC